MGIKKSLFSCAYKVAPRFLLWLLALAILTLEVQAQRDTLGRSTGNGADSVTLSVISSNNKSLDVRAAFYPYAFKPSDSCAKSFRKMLSTYMRIDSLSELALFDKLLVWSHTRFAHDPLNSPPTTVATMDLLERAKKGEKFTCVEYSRVLCDALISLGYYARIVGLSRRNISSPTLGARHVAVEVWSCSNNRWVYLDPQFGMRVQRNNEALNTNQVQQALRLKDSSITIICPDLHSANDARPLTERIEQFKNFISVHSAFLDIPYSMSSTVGMMMLVPDDRNEPLLFQGEPLSNIEYTKDVQQLYAEMGSVHLVLQYDYRSNSPSKPLGNPRYTMRAETSFPWTKSFEVRFDNGLWNSLHSNTVQWAIHPGINEISVRALTSSGSSTKETTMKVYYGERSEARAIRVKERAQKTPGSVSQMPRPIMPATPTP